jgi:hypothetical protein
MPLDVNLLYGEMAGSWLLHLGIPVLATTALGFLPGLDLKQQGLLLLGIVVVVSFLSQAGFLSILQAQSCSGVKDYGGIFKGAAVAAVVTAIMVAVPIFIEPMRLVVSQLFMEHKSLLSSRDQEIETLVAAAGKQVAAVETPVQTGSALQGGGALQVGGALTREQYEKQTGREIMIGAAYWSAFAGAYGIGLGSLFAGKCPATS